MAAGDSHRVATLLLLLLPTADPREDLVKAVQEVISDVPEPKKCEITLMAAQKALDAGVPDRALALCDELAVVPYPRAARLAADLLARADAACTQEVRSRLVALCLLASSRSRPGRDGPAPAECLAQWRAVNPPAHVLPTDEERIRFALAYYGTSQRIAFAALAPVSTAATAEHRAVFMDALVKAAGAEDFDRAAHFALHFMAARASSVATLPGTTTLRSAPPRQRSCGRPLRRRRVLHRESLSTPYAPS